MSAPFGHDNAAAWGVVDAGAHVAIAALAGDLAVATDVPRFLEGTWRFSPPLLRGLFKDSIP